MAAVNAVGAAGGAAAVGVAGAGGGGAFPAINESAARIVAALAGRIRNAAVLAAFGRVARADFLDASLAPRAADEAALPIGYEQTTSAPFVIARMLEMLCEGGDGGAGGIPQKVLEVGSGGGYQTALLAELGCEVVGLERIRPLAAAARARLRRLGYRRVAVHHADGNDGRAADAPFGGIIMCAETDALPPALLAQLADGGRLVAPLRRGGGGAWLCAADNSGAVVARREAVHFVPFRKGVE